MDYGKVSDQWIEQEIAILKSAKRSYPKLYKGYLDAIIELKELRAQIAVLEQEKNELYLFYKTRIAAKKHDEAIELCFPKRD